MTYSCASTNGPNRRIIILISGGGSNMRAILKTAKRDHWHTRYGAAVAAVVSNQREAGGLVCAQEAGVATHVLSHRDFTDRLSFDLALMRLIDQQDVQGPNQVPALIVLAGFMRILSPAFVSHYAGRLLNIHPSLLPAFAGLDTHQRAIDMGCKFAGATVHHVTAALDHGEIVAQAVVPILAGDDAAGLAARVLTQEHLLYPQAIAQWLQAKVSQ
tara:strand:+ start:162 stop:806 length:645 start_codon:yes stop_codon:yes gene_type:complete